MQCQHPFLWGLDYHAMVTRVKAVAGNWPTSLSKGGGAFAASQGGSDLKFKLRPQTIIVDLNAALGD